MTDASEALQIWTIARLKADSGIVALMGSSPSVADFFPPGAAMPYIATGEAEVLDDGVTPTDDSDGYGDLHRLQIRVYSDQEGKGQALQIGDAVKRALRDAGPTSLTDHSLRNIQFSNSICTAEPDGQAYQNIIYFRAVTEEI